MRILNAVLAADPSCASAHILMGQVYLHNGRYSPLPHLHRDWAHPCHILHRDWAHPCHICTRDWAHPCHICTRDWAHPCHICTRDWAHRWRISIARASAGRPRREAGAVPWAGGFGFSVRRERGGEWGGEGGSGEGSGGGWGGGGGCVAHCMGRRIEGTGWPRSRWRWRWRRTSRQCPQPSHRFAPSAAFRFVGFFVASDGDTRVCLKGAGLAEVPVDEGARADCVERTRRGAQGARVRNEVPPGVPLRVPSSTPLHNAFTPPYGSAQADWQRRRLRQATGRAHRVLNE